MKRTMCLIGAVLAVGFLVGCEKKFTQKRFDHMIMKGQSEVEVVKILGQPDAKWEMQNRSVYKWVDWDEGVSGKVIFDQSGAVYGKKWSSSTRQDEDPEKDLMDADWPAGDSANPTGNTTPTGNTSSSSTEVIVP